MYFPTSQRTVTYMAFSFSNWAGKGVFEEEVWRADAHNVHWSHAQMQKAGKRLNTDSQYCFQMFSIFIYHSIDIRAKSRSIRT